MADQFDVIVVGARCAGSSLATLLARGGLEVAVVEQATFPRDTLSSHVTESDALAFLDRLGLTERLKQTGAPFVEKAQFRMEDMQVSYVWPQRPGDVGGVVSIRRHVLDTILAETAAEAGAEVRMGAKATDVLRDGGRVSGIRVKGEDGSEELRARLVVGADGRNSTIAGLCGARAYNVTPNQRLGYWTYFEGADLSGEPTLVFHRWSDRLLLAMPTDAGLYEVVLMPDLAEKERFRGDLEGAFMDHARSCEPVAAVIDGATRTGKFQGAVHWTGFFREASGPGWALVGDAGHFKDPAMGRGIADSFLQVEALATAITAGFGGAAGGLDDALAGWGRWRDREFAEHYWAAVDLGEGGSLSPVGIELVRRLIAQGQFDRFLNLINHRQRPSKLFTLPRLLGATGRLLAQRGRRREVLRETGRLVALQAKREWLNRRPSFQEEPGGGTPQKPIAERLGA